MNEERENGRFDPADFIPADAQPKAAVSASSRSRRAAAP